MNQSFAPRPCWTLPHVKPSGYGPDDPEPREAGRHAGRVGRRIFPLRKPRAAMGFNR